MEIVKLEENNSKDIIKKAVRLFKNGKILVLPTDTVYGILADARNKKTVEKIFKIKKRAKVKPLAVFVKDIKMARKYAFINKEQEKFLRKAWPGKITVILQAKNNLPKGVIAKNKTIGMRIPDYNLIRDLFEKINFPIAQTSANISGNPATVKIREILEQFTRDKIKPSLIIDAGDLSKSRPSKVVDLTEEREKIIRY
ncbi:threonylcarbamoyl-AMP synthase [Patescibacteria group bacterium]|nr:threonylcarbamoyl-AMP synthase [Patescibacteria group bacterium]